MSISRTTKVAFVDAVEEAIKDFLLIALDEKGFVELDEFEFEIHRVKDLEIQVRAKPLEGGPAQYFLIKISTPWS